MLNAYKFPTCYMSKRCASCVLFSPSMLSATGRAYTMLRQNEWCYSVLRSQREMQFVDRIAFITCRELQKELIPVIYMTPEEVFWCCVSCKHHDMYIQGPDIYYNLHSSESVARPPRMLCWLSNLRMLSLSNLYHNDELNKLSTEDRSFMCTIECWLNLWMKGNFSNIRCYVQMTTFLGECVLMTIRV